MDSFRRAPHGTRYRHDEPDIGDRKARSKREPRGISIRGLHPGVGSHRSPESAIYGFRPFRRLQAGGRWIGRFRGKHPVTMGLSADRRRCRRKVWRRLRCGEEVSAYQGKERRRLSGSL